MYTNIGQSASVINQIYKRNSDVQLVVRSHDLKYSLAKHTYAGQVLGYESQKPDQS